jgi:hypothetical protein
MIQAQILIDRFLRNEISQQYKLNAYEKLILFFLASYMGVKSVCYPSYPTLAIECSISVDTVKRSIQSLENRLLIKIVRAKGKNNYYSFTELIIDPVGAHSTQCSEHLGANSSDHQVLTATRVGADSPPNNIINNIKECTSVISLKERQANKSTKTNKSSFPEAMEIGDIHRAIAIQSDLDVEAEYIHFKEHHLSKGSKFLRWDMAFNTWLRNAAKFTKKKSNSTTNPTSGVL